MYGWSQIIIGIVIVIAGGYSLLDPASKRIWIGAFVLGPIFIVRGCRALQEDAQSAAPKPQPSNTEPATASDDDVRSPHRPDPTDPHPDGIQNMALRVSGTRVHVNCEACAKPYVYFPEMTAASLSQYQRIGHCAAPCPRCGWLQERMVDLNGEFSSKPSWSDNCLVPAGLLFLSSAGLLAYNVNKFYGFPPPPDNPYEPIYWYADLALFLAALTCGVIFVFGLYRKPNLNAAPLEKRLAKGKLLGMPLEDFEKLIKTEGLTPVPPLATVTAIQELPQSSTTNLRTSPATGIQKADTATHRQNET